MYPPNATGLAGAIITVGMAVSPLAFAQTAYPSGQPPTSTDARELPAVTVTGTTDDYGAPETQTATRTNTPSLQTPQSVQVVPRAVIEDQSALTLTEAVRNVAGVQYDFGFNGAMQPLLILRGFPTTSMTAMGPMSGISSYYLDGTKVLGVPVNMANVQSVEVIKGPASVLYGRAEPGGMVNVVSKPISIAPAFGFEQTIGQHGLSRTSLEASGALNTDRTLRGRLAASYYTSDSVRDFVKDRMGAFTGSLAWVPDARTNITATLDYSDKRASTNWYREEEFLKKYKAIPANERYTRDGKYWTSAGVTAGMDMSLALLNENWGERYAQGVMLDMEYDPAPPIQGGSPEKTSWLVEWMVKAMYDAGVDPLIKRLEGENNAHAK
ncbi:MAG: TonB-dependent receptor plug domain-containing protein [Thauera sp.]|jgi:iron complex outermembrane receptor protein|nr:TonB-dependent receptor plug domain-containing protein [Thauera sp.]